MEELPDDLDIITAKKRKVQHSLQLEGVNYIKDCKILASQDAEIYLNTRLECLFQQWYGS